MLWPRCQRLCMPDEVAIFKLHSQSGCTLSQEQWLRQSLGQTATTSSPSNAPLLFWLESPAQKPSLGVALREPIETIPATVQTGVLSNCTPTAAEGPGPASAPALERYLSGATLLLNISSRHAHIPSFLNSGAVANSFLQPVKRPFSRIWCSRQNRRRIRNVVPTSGSGQVQPILRTQSPEGSTTNCAHKSSSAVCLGILGHPGVMEHYTPSYGHSRHPCENLSLLLRPRAEASGPGGLLPPSAWEEGSLYLFYRMFVLHMYI